MRRPLLLLLLLAAVPVAAQMAPPQVRVHTRADGATYVYHTLDLLPGQRAVVTREAGGTLDTLAVLEAAATAAEFAGLVGAELETVMALADVPTPAEAFLYASSRPLAGRLLTFLSPGVARALGRLAVDERARPGERVTYRAAPVDDLGRAAGEAVEAAVTITPRSPEAPPTLAAERLDDGITLAWTYPEGETDGVVQFMIYRGEGAARQPVPREAALLRVNNRSEYTARVAVPETEAAVFTVVAVDLTGQQSAPSAPAAIGPGDGRPPEPPGDVGAAARLDGVAEVSWPVSTAIGAAGYHVYRAPHAAGPYARLTGAPLALLETVFEDATAPEGRASYYAVTVVDAQGVEGPRSGAALVTVDDRTPPPPVEALAADIDAAAGTVALDWDHDAPPDLWSYTVTRQRIDRPGLAPVQLDENDLRRTFFVDTGATGNLAEGAVFRYVVVARDSARNASAPAELTLQLPDVTPPGPPTDLVAEVDDAGRAILRWQPPGDLDVGRYVLYRDGAEIARTDRVRRLVRDEGVALRQSYRYTVTAIDTLGNEGPPSRAATLTVADPDPPRRVYNLRAEREGGRLRLVWPAVPDADLAGYRIEQSDQPTGVFESVGGLRQPEADARGEVAVTPPPGAGPWLRVVALDTSGNASAPSAAVRAD